MASKLEPAVTAAPRVARNWRAHAFLGAVIVGVLIGGGLRFVPYSEAATPGSEAAGQASPAATACAAQ
jgi:hypothetical protein